MEAADARAFTSASRFFRVSRFVTAPGYRSRHKKTDRFGHSDPSVFGRGLRSPMRLLAFLVLAVCLCPVSGYSQTDPTASAAKALLVKIDDYKPPLYTEDSTDWDYKKEWLKGFLRYLE